MKVRASVKKVCEKCKVIRRHDESPPGESPWKGRQTQPSTSGCRTSDRWSASSDPAAVARKVADRHFGVGGDGLILVLPSDKADVRMRMFNADGGEAEMCGNGARCFARYIQKTISGTGARTSFETIAGVISATFEGERVRVNLTDPQSRLMPTRKGWLQGQATNNLRGSYTYFNGDKVKFGRNAGPLRPK